MPLPPIFLPDLSTGIASAGAAKGRKPRRYARNGRKILSWELEKDRLFEALTAPLQDPTPPRRIKKWTLPEALVSTPLTLPQAPHKPVLSKAEKAKVIQLLRPKKRDRVIQTRVIEAAIDLDDEEALLMILLEAA